MNAELFNELGTFATAYHTLVRQLSALVPTADEVRQAGVGGQVHQEWTLDDLVAIVNQSMTMELGLQELMEKFARRSWL